MLINRKLRMEYGEDRSKRRPKRANDFGDHSNNNNDSYKENNRTVNDKPEFDSLNQRFDVMILMVKEIIKETIP